MYQMVHQSAPLDKSRSGHGADRRSGFRRVRRSTGGSRRRGRASVPGITRSRHGSSRRTPNAARSGRRPRRARSRGRSRPVPDPGRTAPRPGVGSRRREPTSRRTRRCTCRGRGPVGDRDERVPPRWARLSGVGPVAIQPTSDAPSHSQNGCRIPPRGGPAVDGGDGRPHDAVGHLDEHGGRLLQAAHDPPLPAARGVRSLRSLIIRPLSGPQLPRGQRRPLDEGPEFRPLHRRMHGAPAVLARSRSRCWRRPGPGRRAWPAAGTRSATSSGCSTTLVAWLIRPGIRTLSSGSSTSCQIRHSCSWRGLAISSV